MSDAAFFVGLLCVSKHGHDKGEAYIITKVADDKVVLVANGRNRLLAAPKRKNIRHLSISKYHAAATSDVEIKRAVDEFQKKGK